MAFPFIIGALVLAGAAALIGIAMSDDDKKILKQDEDELNQKLQQAQALNKQAAEAVLAERNKAYKELGELNKLKQEITGNEIEHLLNVMARRSKSNSSPEVILKNTREGFTLRYNQPNISRTTREELSSISHMLNSDLSDMLARETQNVKSATGQLKASTAQLHSIRLATRELKDTLVKLRKVFQKVKVDANASKQQFDAMHSVGMILVRAVNQSVLTRDGKAIPDIKPVCNAYLKKVAKVD